MKNNATTADAPAKHALDASTNPITTPTKDPRLDGPCHPFSVRFNGIVVGKMRSGTWKMLLYLWHCADRTATFDDLLLPVYDDIEHLADNDAFGSLCRSANQFFIAHGIPWRAGVKKGFVYLESTK